MQPGETVTPGTGAPEQPTQPTDTPAAAAPAPETTWEFKGEDNPAGGEQPTKRSSSHDAVAWTASEYIAHEKGIGWFASLGLIIAATSLGVFLVTQELLSTIVIVIIGIAFGVFAARQPQELQYRVDQTGIHIGPKVFMYGQFKSFTVVEEGAISSIMLMPLQRFMPPLSIYYAPEDEDRIAEALGNFLPYEQRKQDYIDRIMRKIRF